MFITKTGHFYLMFIVTRDVECLQNKFAQVIVCYSSYKLALPHKPPSLDVKTIYKINPSI